MFKYVWPFISTTQLAWDFSERSQSDLHLERHLIDLLEISQKRWLFCDVSETLRLLKNISRKYSGLFKNTSQKKWFCVIFRMVITISNKIDVGPLKTLKKWNVFWEQCRNINHVCHEYQWADVSVRVLVGQLSSKPNIRYTIYYF